jgi:hypothetical protein
VVSTFLLTPAPVPRLVDPDRRIYGLDDDAVIVYRNALNSDIEVIGVSTSTVSGNGEVRIPAGTLSTGHYSIVLSTPGSEAIRSDFWIVDRNASPTVNVARDTYRTGEAIEIDWQNGPGNRNDYLGIYEVGIESTYIPDYDGGLTWLYINALPEGSIRLDEASSEVMWPLPRGKYVARLLKDDGYEVLAESKPFEVL